MNNLMSINNANYTCEDDIITMQALPKTDYFVNPENDDVTGNAQFLYKEITGDFTMVSKVSHEFKSTYDACVLFAYDNDKRWAKACFELTDFGTKAVVSVMTNGKSDDANGVNVDVNEIWLRLSRKKNTFAVHYSLDGETFFMARISNIPMNDKIKVGIVAQSPVGEGGARIFKSLKIEQTTLENLRAGR